MPGDYPNLYQMARKCTRLTQEQAAEGLGVSYETVKQYEGGRRVPPDTVVGRMVDLYGAPWLALAHSEATDTLGVLPHVQATPLPMASIALRNRLHDATGRLDALLRIAEDGRIDETERPEFDEIVADLRSTMAAIYQVIYSPEGAKKERLECSASKRSSQGALVKNQPSQQGYCTTNAGFFASPNFAGTGGDLL